MKKLIISLFIFSLFFNTAQSQCSDEVLTAFGGISSLAMYNTYLSIGAIGDGYTSNVYDVSQVQNLMTEQINMIDVIDEMLDSTLSQTSLNSLSENDRNFVKEIKVTFKYLKAEANALKDYSQDLSDVSIASYNENRDLAWKKISELMGLEN